MPRDTPLSIYTKQKDNPDLRFGDNPDPKRNPVEVPLNAFIQKKLGLSAGSATRIAKGIGSALQAKGIAIAENKIKEAISSLLEVTTAQATKNSIRQQLQKGLRPGANDAIKQDANKKALALHQLAKSGNAEKFYNCY